MIKNWNQKLQVSPGKKKKLYFNLLSRDGLNHINLSLKKSDQEGGFFAENKTFAPIFTALEK